MKKRALATGGTKKDVAAMAVLIINIKQTNPNLVDEIVIFHDGISKKDQMLMYSILPCRFIYYQFPNYDPNDFNDYVNKYFSPMVFCKYECFRLLEEYQLVIWSDYDVVILKDLSELLVPPPEGISLKMLINDNNAIGAFTDEITKIDMSMYDAHGIGICSSLFVIFDTLKNYLDCYDWLLQKTREWGKYLYLVDQAPLNLVLQEFKLNVLNLDGSFYSINPVHELVTDQTKILHAYGQPKFWNGLTNETWENNYVFLRKTGISPFIERTFSYKLKLRLKNIRKVLSPRVKNIIKILFSKLRKSR